MATRPLSPTLRRACAAAFAGPLWLRPAAVLALAVPPLFLHAEYQPGFVADVGSTSVAVKLSDLAVLAVLVAAAVQARRLGFALRASAAVWAALAAFLLWVAAASLYGALVLDGFPTLSATVTAAKFGEYALLAPATAVLVRSRADLRPLLVVVVAWTTLAALVAVVQALGGDVFQPWAAGRRQPSFLGHHDLATLSEAALLAGLGGLVLLGVRGWGRWTAVAAGGVGAVAAAALAGALGLILAVAALLALAAANLRPFPRQRALLAAALTVVIVAGILAVRAGNLGDFLRFLADDEPTTEVDTYSQRTVLAYIGFRIFLDHPVVGVGFQGSSQPAAFEPYLEDARAAFPDAAPLAFPSDERRYGVQNAYVQALADLGLVGFILLVAVFGAAATLAVRNRRDPSTIVGLLWLLLVAGLWSGQGLLAGLPLAALTWIALGLAASRGQSDQA